MSGRELWVFETMQGSGGPPGGLPPQHAVRNALSEQGTAPAQRNLSLTAAVWWEDEGGLETWDRTSPARDAEPETQCSCWTF